MTVAVSVAFTLTAAVAIVLHSTALWQAWLDRRAIGQSLQHLAADEPDRLNTVANALIVVEITRLAINLLLLLAGIGALLHDPPLLYLIALIPAVSIISSLWGIWVIRKQLPPT